MGRARAATSRARRDDRGAATAAIVLGAGLLMVAFTTLTNLIIYQYGEGALRSAAEQAVRVGSRASGSEEACEQRGTEALDALLGGSLRSSASVECEYDPQAGTMHAVARANFQGWLATVPDWNARVEATARQEQNP